MSDWKKAEKRTDEFLRKSGLHYRKNARQIARAGFFFWVGLGALGSFSLTRPLWTWAMIVMGSYLVIDYLFLWTIDIKESKPDSGYYQAHIPPEGRVVSARTAYLVFVLLMLGTALVADQLVSHIETFDSFLPLWVSSLMWSVPVSAVLSARILEYYHERISRRRRKQ